jgi:uncharacterized membrane protein
MLSEKKFRSKLSGIEFPLDEMVSGSTIRHSILSLIQKENPKFSSNDFIAESELNHFREKYISEYLAKQIGELSELEKTVLHSLSEQTLVTDKVDSDFEGSLSFGQKVADKVASFGGSWKFIISFGVFILIWILLNVLILSEKSFDAFPFILLNLILSCIAALQAPVIMMSQNRQEEKDRERSKKDYMVNLKSELEIRMLHEKIDHLIIRQQQDMIELQKIQIEMINKNAKQ